MRKKNPQNQRKWIGIKKETRIYIEFELRDYHKTVAQLNESYNNLLNESPPPPDGMPHGTDVGNPTENKVIRLLTCRQFKYMTEIVEAISLVLDSLPSDKLEYVKLKYWTQPQHLNDSGIAYKIGCDKTTLWRWNEEIISKIAMALGIIAPH